MGKDIQISAFVSPGTKELLERHVRATGLKKGYLVEQALLHHLLALDQVPAEYVVHPRIVVTRESGKAVIEQSESGHAPAALRDLMRDGN